ncbi:hypothetical protein [Mycobacterium sp. 050134]
MSTARTSKMTSVIPATTATLRYRRIAAGSVVSEFATSARIPGGHHD